MQWRAGLLPGYMPTVTDLEALAAVTRAERQWRELMIEGVIAQIRKPTLIVKS